MRETWIYKNRYFVFWTVVIVAVVGIGVYFGTNNGSSSEATPSTQDMGPNFRITFWNTAESNVENSFSEHVRNAVSFWQERLVEEERIKIDVKSTRLNTRTTLAYAMMNDASNIRSGGELTINLNASAYSWTDVIKHEIGHILGIGVADNWRNAVIGSNRVYYLDRNLFPETYRIYQEDYNGQEDHIPLGDSSHHFDEAVFDTELMTPYSDEGLRQPITDLTMTALQVIGWNVDMSKAEEKN